MKPEKRGVDLYASLEFFLDFGVKILEGRLIHAVDLYMSIYGIYKTNKMNNLYVL